MMPILIGTFVVLAMLAVVMLNVGLRQVLRLFRLACYAAVLYAASRSLRDWHVVWVILLAAVAASYLAYYQGITDVLVRGKRTGAKLSST